MATLGLNNSEIVRSVLQVSGLGRDAANLDAATEADVRQIVRSGLRRFYFPSENGFVYQWRFLETVFSVSADDHFSDGTVTIAPDSGGSIVTLDSGTWPTDLTDYLIDVDGHILFFTERTDDDEAKVSHTQITVDAGTSYEARRFRYSLPDDFGEFMGGVTYAKESKDWRLIASDEPSLRLRYAIDQSPATSETTYYAVHNKQLYLWPEAEPSAFIQGVYLAVPDDNLPADLTTPGSTAQVDPIYAEAMLEAILAQAEAYNDDGGNGLHEQKFQLALQAAIAHDRNVAGHYDFSRRVGPDYKGVGTILNIDFTDA